jgi:hypothetical protein
MENVTFLSDINNVFKGGREAENAGFFGENKYFFRKNEIFFGGGGRPKGNHE